MSKLRQILKMYSQSLSKQYISDTTGVARNTVKSHLRTFNALNKSIEELLALDDTGLEAVFKGVPGIRNEAGDKMFIDFTGEKRPSTEVFQALLRENLLRNGL